MRLQMNRIEIDELKDRLFEVFSEKNVRKVILFGSAARDRESRKSDLDLLIVIDTEKRFFERYDDFFELYGLVGGRNLDLLIYTPEELQAISHRKFIQTIINEGQILYEH